MSDDDFSFEAAAASVGADLKKGTALSIEAIADRLGVPASALAAASARRARRCANFDRTARGLWLTVSA
jgi:hypothetical protein